MFCASWCPDFEFRGGTGLRFAEKQSRELIGLVLTAGLTFFWTIPVAAISALTSLSSLESFFPVLTPFLSDPMVSDFISGTLPSGLLIATMSVLPYLLRFIALYIGKTSETEVTETSLLLTMVTHGPCWGLHRERERDMLRRFSHFER